MSPVRLLGGWLLLCGLAAGGAYFAMDEVDRRVDLVKYDLRAKVGLSSAQVQPAPAPLPNPPTPGPGAGGSVAPVVAPPPQPQPQPQPPVSHIPPGGGTTPVQPVTGGGGPGQGRPGQGGIVRPPSGGGGVTPPVGGGGATPGGGGAAPSGGGNPPVVTPPGGQVAPIPNPQPPLRQTPPPVTPPQTDPSLGQVTRPDPKSTEQWRALNSTYEQMSPRADAVLNYLDQMKRQTERNRGVFRTDLQTAMFSLKDSMAAARRTLNAGDVEGARGYLATAYQQLAFLEQNRR